MFGVPDQVDGARRRDSGCSPFGAAGGNVSRGVTHIGARRLRSRSSRCRPSTTLRTTKHCSVAELGAARLERRRRRAARGSAAPRAAATPASRRPAASPVDVVGTPGASSRRGRRRLHDTVTDAASNVGVRLAAPRPGGGSSGTLDASGRASPRCRCGDAAARRTAGGRRRRSAGARRRRAGAGAGTAARPRAGAARRGVPAARRPRTARRDGGGAGVGSVRGVSVASVSSSTNVTASPGAGRVSGGAGRPARASASTGGGLHRRCVPTTIRRLSAARGSAA